MKNIILFLLVLFCATINAQRNLRTANLEIPFILRDNSNPPHSSQILTAGLDSTATDGIDIHLGEYPLLCVYHFFMKTDCPPVDVFKAILQLPPQTTNSEISFKDFRLGMLPYTGQKVHRIRYQMHSSATSLEIEWNFPSGVEAQLQDPFGGILLNETLSDSGVYSIPSQYFQLGLLILLINYNNAVPVDLLSINALHSGSKVKINWKTSSETNNHGFEIEKCQITKGNAQTRWEAIGFVEGNGTTTETHSYSFIDENIFDAKIKYRLKQIDYDGSFNYSNEVVVDIKITPEKFILYQNYPNPFNPATSIKFSVPKQTQLKINLYNVLGEFIQTITEGLFEGGSHLITFNAKNLSSGIYIYSMESAELTLSRMMTLIK